MAKTYIGQIMETINEVTERCGPVLLFGENIDTGSRIAGLARGLKVNPAGRIQNVGNCELTHIGLGLGMMLDGGNAVVFMKQLDFLLLGIDQMVNTFNFIRTTRPQGPTGSFTIYVIVCDQGYQGPQSSLNAASDLASMANINVFCLNGAADASRVIDAQFVSPGFRVICVSQRLFGAPALDAPAESHSDDNSLFRYRSGNEVTIASYNFALRDALELGERLAAHGVQSDVFHVNYIPGMDLRPLVESCRRTGALIVLDDSKSVTKFGDILVSEVQRLQTGTRLLSMTRRGVSSAEYGVIEDRFRPDAQTALEFVRGAATVA